MRTSLTEIEQIEKHLCGQLSNGEDLLFQANLLLNEDLAENTRMQGEVYGLVQAYGRRKLRLEIETVHEKVFSEPAYSSFCKRIMSFFL